MHKSYIHPCTARFVHAITHFSIAALLCFYSDVQIAAKAAGTFVPVSTVVPTAERPKAAGAGLDEDERKVRERRSMMEGDWNEARKKYQSEPDRERDSNSGRGSGSGFRSGGGNRNWRD